MSKQLKYQLKKTLKKAEFVHADLEYHEEVGVDASNLFNKRIQELFMALPDDVKEQLLHYQSMKAAAAQAAAVPTEEPEEDLEESDDETTDIVPTDIEPSAPTEEEKEIEEVKMKDSELKKLFRRIAALSHPDKLAAAGLSETEVERMEKIFKRARAAFERENWFVLYTIAVDLGLELDTESERHIHWIEQDIKNTERLIAELANRTYWHWYSADSDTIKNNAIRHYFLHVYNYDYPGL